MKYIVIPANAGIQGRVAEEPHWTPACARVTER